MIVLNILQTAHCFFQSQRHRDTSMKLDILLENCPRVQNSKTTLMPFDDRLRFLKPLAIDLRNEIYRYYSR